MLAVFGRETAHPPTLIESEAALKKTHQPVLQDEERDKEERLCGSIIGAAFESAKPTIRHQQMVGKGSGFLYESSPYCSYAERAGVHVLFSGEVSDWPGVNAVSAAHDAFVRNEPPLEANDAHWLLDFYATFNPESSSSSSGAANAEDARQEAEDTAQRALECLSQVKGSFAFVIYDSLHHRVLAARDSEGVQPLYWGCTDEGQLLFGSYAADLKDCNPTATLFPAGTLFASERHMVAYSPGEYGWVIVDDDYPGQLLSFIRGEKAHTWRGVKAIPRVTSKGVVCGAVYKVASAADVRSGSVA